MIIKQRIQKADGTIRYRNYLKQQRLGKGGFAECFLVQRMQDKKSYALKIIPKKLLTRSKARQKMLSEIKLHRAAKHKNICELQRAFQDQDNVYMLLQLCSNRNLFQLMQRRKKLTVPETQYFIYQLIDSLCYLHNRQIIHRDVKLGNLLLNPDMQLKLADFGLATKIQFSGDRKHTVCGTPNYIAPEIIRSSMGIGHSGHSYEVDIWSTGVILYVMLVGRAPFETSKIEKTYEKITRGEFAFPEHFRDESAKDLIKKILVVDPSKRYTFQQILSHPFMNPKNGIPKQIPISAMNTAPKFATYEKITQDDVRQSARNASINTLRTSIDQSIQQDFQGGDPETERRQNSRSRDVKGLLKSVFSTTSLSKSIEKLSSIGKSITCSSPQAKQLKSLTNSQVSASSGNITSRSKTKFFSSVNITSNSNLPQSADDDEYKSPIYIVEYRKEIVWSYVLSNGVIGTFQSQDNNYKILYNSRDKVYYEIQNDGNPKRVKAELVGLNQSISNRMKFIDAIASQSKTPCYSTISKPLIYLKRVFQVKSDSMVLFKLSNNDIQSYNYDTNTTLLVTNDQLHLIQIKQGKQTQRIVEKKDRYAQCKNKTLISMYLKVKKILIKISNMGKQ